MLNQINGETRLACLLGSPVTHSKSPSLHNKWFNENGINCVYLCFDASANTIKNAVSAMRMLNVIGFNVTMPCKTLVMPELDEISEEAALIGAVNTVVCNGGKLTGYNTDGAGFVKSLSDEGVIIKEKNITICGAGGAGRAVGVALALAGAGQISVFDINAEAAQNLAQTINNNTAARAEAVILKGDAINAAACACDIFINCTAVGMHPDISKTPVNPDIFNASQTVADCIYEPSPTAMLAAAAKKGAKTVSGIGMLKNQAVLAFKLWTGITPAD